MNSQRKASTTWFIRSVNLSISSEKAIKSLLLIYKIRHIRVYKAPVNYVPLSKIIAKGKK
jgi:hypothetical protein